MRNFLKPIYIAAPWCIVCLTVACAEETATNTDELHKPVYRVTTKQEPLKMIENKQHPLDPALVIAEESLENIRRSVDDYTCTIIKRERVNRQLRDEEYMFAKIRNRKVEDGRVVTPFSVYLKFLKPRGIAGREVIYVGGENNGKLIAHEGGLKGRVMPSIWLPPNGMLAMQGQRYPITEIGMETLCLRLIERGERDRSRGPCDVQIQGAKINKRPCTCIQVKHEQQKPHLDFHLARIFVDKELNVPVRYEAYDWPSSPDSPPELIEAYTYVNVKTNVGLTDADFDPSNPTYNMK